MLSPIMSDSKKHCDPKLIDFHNTIHHHKVTPIELTENTATNTAKIEETVLTQYSKLSMNVEEDNEDSVHFPLNPQHTI